MTIVPSYAWESDPYTHHTATDARATWRAAVAEIAAKAHAKLPECNGRVDAAVKIVLAGDVTLLPDGTARVASQSNGTTAYHIVNGHCDCKDFARAPHGFCKHRLRAAIVRRAQELVTAQRASDQAAAPSQPTPVPLPEAPASVNVHLDFGGRQVQLTLRDTDEGRLLARLEAVLQRFPLVVPPSSPPARTDGWCAKHGIQMKLNHGKDGRTWYSHKTAEGWCKGK
jgi:hypothetical protein